MKKKISVFLLVGLLTPEFASAQGTTTFISNLGQPSSGSLPISSDSWFAAAFQTGNNPGGYQLSTIELSMASPSGNPTGFNVSLYSLDRTGPGIGFGNLAGSDPAASGVFTYSASEITLSPSTGYFIVVTATAPAAQGSYYWNKAGNSDYNSADGWLLGTDHYSSTDGLNWSFSRSDSFQFAITALPVPEPSTWALLLIGSGALLFRRRS